MFSVEKGNSPNFIDQIRHQNAFAKRKGYSVSFKPLEPISPALDALSVPVAKNRSISSRPEDNDLDLVRNRLRINFFKHKEYEPNLDPESNGKLYFDGVYEHNNLKHISENRASEGQPTNLYAFLHKQKLDKRIAKTISNSVKAKDLYPLTDWVASRADKPTEAMMELEVRTKREL